MLKFNKLFGVMALLLVVGCHDAYSIPRVQPVHGGAGEVLVKDAETFRTAVKAAVPDTVIVWADGEYSDISLKLTADGSEESPVVLRAQTPGKVVFKGHSSIQLQGSWLVAEGFSFTSLDTSVKGSVLTFAKGCSNCRISHCKIDGKGSRVSDVDTKWVSMYGQYNEISHCTFLEKKNMGCLLVVWMEDGIVPYHTISDNYFYRPYTHYDENGKARNGQEAIRIGTSDFSMNDAFCYVSGNWFYRCNGERAEIISNKSCHNVYEENLFEEGEGSLTLRHGNDCTVRGNYFLSGGRGEVGGVRIIGERHLVEGNWFLNLTGSNYKAALCVVTGETGAALNGYWTAIDCKVKDNYFVDCYSGIVVNYGARSTQDSAPANLLVSGNTLVSGKSSMNPVIVMPGTPPSAVIWESNTIYGGKQKGVSLGTVKEKPEIVLPTDAISKIRNNAGIQWK